MPASETPASASQDQDAKMATPPKLVIDVFSDVVCPWCYVGTERLRQVLTTHKLREATQVNYHPFFLDPTTPEEGKNLAKTLREKYGRDPKDMYAAVEKAGRDVGVNFKFSEDQRGYPTRRAHALLAFARDAAESGETKSEWPAPGPLNLVDAVKRNVLKAYFEDHANINDAQVLADIASAQGLNGEKAKAYVDDKRVHAEVMAHAEEGRRLGIQGVPFFIFGGVTYASGAQPESVFEGALRKAFIAKTEGQAPN